MRKTTQILALCLITLNVFAQRGARIGFLMGVGKTSITSADDKAAPANTLKLLPSGGYSFGVEAGYHWRFMNASIQFAQTKNNQSYNYFGNNAYTSLNYFRPTALIGFNSNMNKNVRFIGQIGAAYGLLTSYKEVVRGFNPVTGAITYEEFSNTNYTFRDTNTTTGTLSEGLYYKSDISAIVAIGMEIRMSKRWNLTLQTRVDYGLEALENYNKIKTTTTVNEITSTNPNYEHWRYTPYKFETDYFYNGVRKPSKNLSIGGFFSFKYSIPSKKILDIEMDEF